MNQVIGLGWLFVALFDGTYALFDCVAGLLFPASAALRFRDSYKLRPEVKRTALWSRL